MKKHIYFGAMCLLGVGLGACSDSFLDKEALGSISATSAFSSTITATKMVNAIYDPLGWERGYATTYWAAADCMSGDSEVGGEVGGKDRPALQDMMVFASKPNNVDLGDMFRYMVNGAQRATTAIEGLTSKEAEKMPQSDRNALLGQAYFMRAFYNFDLVRLYGPFPVGNDNRPDGDDPQGSLQVGMIYSMIIADLEAAAPLLPMVWGSDNSGRASAGAAYGYLAKAHINYASFLQGGDYKSEYVYPRLSNFTVASKPGFNTAKYHWEKAYESAEKVVASGKYDLLNSYQDIFLEKNENSIESIFEAQYMDGLEYGAKSEGTIGNIYLSPRNYSLDKPDNGKIVLTGWGFNAPHPDYVKAFFKDAEQTEPSEEKKAEDFDPRLDMVGKTGVWFKNPDWVSYTKDGKSTRAYYNNSEAPYGANKKNGGGFVSKKHELLYDGSRSYGNVKATGQNWVILRYADILLMKAEAAANIGKSDEAVALVNEIRKRARESKRNLDGSIVAKASMTFPKDIANLSGTALIEAIWHERRLELGLECQRFFDIVRTGQIQFIFGERVKANATEGSTRARPFEYVKGKSERLPIPEQIVLDGKNNVVQNYMY